MRLLLVGACSSLLFLVGCGVDPTTAAGAASGLKAAPSQSKVESRKAGGEQQEYSSPKSTARKAGEEQQEYLSPKSTVQKAGAQQPKTAPRADSLGFDGVDGESQDKDHKGWAVKLDGVDGESKDDEHASDLGTKSTTQHDSRIGH
jgi:hypothetical protein